MNGISVVVPTRDSNDTVPALFESLGEARARLDAPSEVIVVDDSGPAERAELERLCARHGVRLLSAGPHVGGKRNLGAAAARYDLLLFVDSDCHASPELLREHWATCRSAGACAGPVEFVGPRSWLWPALDLLGMPAGFRLPAARARVLWAPTANLSVSRACFEAVGGFDETLPGPIGGEDVDIGIRLTGRGVAIECNARAIVRHSTSTWNSPRAMLKRLLRYGRSEPDVMVRHPRWRIAAVPGHLTLLASGALLWLVVGLLAGLGPLLALLWPASYLGAWLLRVLRTGMPEPRVLQAVAVSVLLEAAYEAGRLAACWRLGRPGWMACRMLLDDRAMAGEWSGGGARAWCWSVAWALCAAVWLTAGR
jgi:GT2 family glycosyltransferase